ncbi:MAG: hypothetical protein KIS78_22975 [Labilithrix sp.]|nr:hypothetical protein [Labilithrix sp.]MCW5835282.1 hypothetical protein [Labilithrix sp.]
MKLFGFELAWAAAAFDAVFPEGTALPHGIARMNPARSFADTVATSPLEQSLGLRATLWIVALAPLWFSRRPRTIRDIPPEERRRVLERLLASPVYAVRQLVVAFKAMGSMLYARSPEARAAMTTPRRRVALAPSGAESLVTIRASVKAREEGDAHGHAAE